MFSILLAKCQHACKNHIRAICKNHFIKTCNVATCIHICQHAKIYIPTYTSFKPTCTSKTISSYWFCSWFHSKVSNFDHVLHANISLFMVSFKKKGCKWFVRYGRLNERIGFSSPIDRFGQILHKACDRIVIRLR